MTSFARSQTQQNWGKAQWEIRTVNHRYLEISLKVPENFKQWEHLWRQQVGETLGRGKVECALSFQPGMEGLAPVEMNTPLIEQLLSQANHLAQYSRVETAIPAMDLLRWPGVLVAKTSDMSLLQDLLTDLLSQALQESMNMRLREGAQIQTILKTKLTQVVEQIDKIKSAQPSGLETQKQKILKKLNEISVSFDTQRLEQELVYHAQRMDIEEEINRLIMHVNETEHTLNTEGQVGRRLDFLMQEMNREANTIAAKTPVGDISIAAIELKVLIEQMREQIQNVE